MAMLGYKVPLLTTELTTYYTTECLVETTNLENLIVKKLIDQDDILAKVFAVKKVKNNFLEALFILKKQEIIIRHGNVSEQYMIHITGAAKVNSIIRNNFDWRRVKRCKFGKGTSFSKDATYANRQANRNSGCNRALIISRVLVSRTGQGFKDQIVPRNMFDTSVGNKEKVFVKFYDNEMLPLYVAFFCESNDDIVTRPVFNWPKCDNLHPISELGNKSLNGPISTPERNKKTINKPFDSQNNEVHSNVSKTIPRSILECSGQNRTCLDQNSKSINNIYRPNLNTPKTNHMPTNVPSQYPNYGPFISCCKSIAEFMCRLF